MERRQLWTKKTQNAIERKREGCSKRVNNWFIGNRSISKLRSALFADRRGAFDKLLAERTLLFHGHVSLEDNLDNCAASSTPSTIVRKRGACTTLALLCSGKCLPTNLQYRRTFLDCDVQEDRVDDKVDNVFHEQSVVDRNSAGVACCNVANPSMACKHRHTAYSLASFHSGRSPRCPHLASTSPRLCWYSVGH